MYECLIIPIERSDEFVIQQFSVFEVIPVEESECCEVQDDKEISDIGFEIPLHDVLQEVDQEVVEGQYHPKLEDGSHPLVLVGHQVLEGEEGGDVEDEQLARAGVTSLQKESSPSKKAIYGIIYFVNSQLTMEGSRYYGENPYLSSIFQKQ